MYNGLNGDIMRMVRSLAVWKAQVKTLSNSYVEKNNASDKFSILPD